MPTSAFVGQTTVSMNVKGTLRDAAGGHKLVHFLSEVMKPIR